MSPKLFLLPITLLALGECSSLSAQGLVINNGSNVVVNGASSIVINNGGFSNSGTFNAGTGTLAFTGTSAATISGSTATSFYNFLINKPGSSVALGRNASVTNTLSMGNGNLNLSGFDLNLGTTGSLSGERGTSRVLGPSGGYLISSATLNAPVRVNPGNIGLEITTTANPGLVTLKRGHQPRQLEAGFSIQRFFDITAANNIGENATLRFYYFNEELGNIKEGELGVYSVTAAVPGGELQPQSTVDTIANYVEVSKVALAGVVVPASTISDPARSAYFTAVLLNGKALLSWGTLYEINADHFELERSVDGSAFQRFANVTASGTTAVASDYTYTDPEPLVGPYFGTSPRYYRYKIVFKDGTYRYSNIVSLAPDGYPNHILSVSPNPTNGPVNVRFSSFRNQKVILQVVDNAGSVVAQKEMNAIIGANLISVDISHVIKGIYYVRLINIERNAYKILKQ